MDLRVNQPNHTVITTYFTHLEDTDASSYTLLPSYIRQYWIFIRDLHHTSLSGDILAEIGDL